MADKLDPVVLAEFLHEMGNALAVIQAKTERGKPVGPEEVNRVADSFLHFARHARNYLRDNK